MNAKPVRSVPEGYTAVTPWVIGPDTAGLLDFVVKAFGAEELFRVEDGNGRIGHAEFRIGDAIVMGFDQPDGWEGSPAFLRLYVDDCDATFASAVAAGGRPHTEPTTAPFGDRVARVYDPFGNLWWIHTRVEEVPEDELARRLNDPQWIAAMEYLQGRVAKLKVSGSGAEQ